MPGPPPKALELRQRRNKVATRATLPAEDSPITNTPRLPKNPLGQWNKLTRAWWKDVWSSPQSSEFLRADLGSLFRLAILVDMFWKSGKLAVAKEIRLLEREFGLTPMARRRLEWQVTQTEEAKDRHDNRRARQARSVDSDPRGALE
jgi:hypothetical protein